MSTWEQIIARLRLEPLLPEGGYFARTWTGADGVTGAGPSGTAIYFLLTTDTFSAFHRLRSDEVWHFYAGDPVEHWQLSIGQPAIRTILGPEVLGGEVPQLVVPSHTWQAAKLASPNAAPHGWSLLGCTLAPGWRDEDFELGPATSLLREFPESATVVRLLART